LRQFTPVLFVGMKFIEYLHLFVLFLFFSISSF
jgi:hypothetical protein